MKKLFALLLVVAAAPLAAQWTTNGTHIHNTNSGNVGIGVTTPAARLVVADAGTGNTLFLLGRPSDGTGGFQFRDAANATTLGYVIVESAEFRFFHNAGFMSYYTAGAERMRINASGNVGIGTTSPTSKLHVVGDAFFSGAVTGGNIQAKYQDVAEWVPAPEQFSPGTVVVLDSSVANRVVKSTIPYDTSVAGVVSEKPGLLLGEAGDDKVMVATTGRVKVLVDATSAPIRIGDLLVTSDKAGVAMASRPLLVNGAKLHRPGTVVGKALEPLASGQGEILVLLSLQ
jgi:hypothetical protein